MQFPPSMWARHVPLPIRANGAIAMGRGRIHQLNCVPGTLSPLENNSEPARAGFLVYHPPKASVWDTLRRPLGFSGRGRLVGGLGRPNTVAWQFDSLQPADQHLGDKQLESQRRPTIPG
jgi:hypothetical protein